MRLVVLADIHGNLPALKAVLKDIKEQGTPDICWVLGDLSVYFPWSNEVVAFCQQATDILCLAGNLDRYLTTGYRPAIPLSRAEEWKGMTELLRMREERFSWVLDSFTTKTFQFLQSLPRRLEIDVPNYGKVVGVHAAPHNDETFLLPSMADAEIYPHLKGLDARLLLYGHTHISLDRNISNWRLVNPGSTALSWDGDPRVSYAQLDFANGQCTVILRRVGYDIETMIKEMIELDFPAAEQLAQMARHTSKRRG